MVEPGKPAWHKIRQEFGSDVFLESKHLDRSKLSELIFNDIEKRRKLNSITHPDIYKEIYWQTIEYFLRGHSFIILALPLLFETGHMLNYLHKIIVVAWYMSIYYISFVRYLSYWNHHLYFQRWRFTIGKINEKVRFDRSPSEIENPSSITFRKKSRKG